MNRWGWQSPGSLVNLRISCLIRADHQSHRWVWSSLKFSLIHSSEGKFSWCRLEKMLNQRWEMPKCTVIKAAEAPFCSSHPGVRSKISAASRWLLEAFCEASAGSEKVRRRKSYLQMASRWWDHDNLLFCPPGSSWYDSHRDLPDYYLSSFPFS